MKILVNNYNNKKDMLEDIKKGKKILADNNYTVKDIITFLLLDSPDMSIDEILKDIYIADTEEELQAVKSYLYNNLK